MSSAGWSCTSLGTIITRIRQFCGYYSTSLVVHKLCHGIITLGLTINFPTTFINNNQPAFVMKTNAPEPELSPTPYID